MEDSSSSLINLYVDSLLGYPTLLPMFPITSNQYCCHILHRTWAHLSYVEGLKSDHTSAPFGSVINNFFEDQTC